MPIVVTAVIAASFYVLTVDCLVDSADLIWYEKDNDEPQYYYYASRDVPQGLTNTRKIIVNQRIARLRQFNYSNLENLEELKIDFCKVKEIVPGAFDSLRAIVTLTLCGNNIADIEKDVFNNLQVENLNLSNNYITYIHAQAFDNMTNLRSIILDYNQLKCWSSMWFQNTPSLAILSFRHNLFEELPDNALINFRGEIKNRTEISFDFGYNKIHIIHPRAFKCIEEFNVLNLEYNKLLMLKVETFRNVTRIKSLNLKGNPLTCFPKELLQVILEKVKNPSI
ncbi:hypothetical protein WA026_001012 [Henosepilachna vigintioctopunctata]|uniref:Uncharacterized protein n=1 Tax=Henosepilachna vigintioctopunctata TaxID=420089 RepID=A0AAW1V144_9CUCU